MRVIKKGLDAVKGSNPNLVEIAAKAVFQSFNPPTVADPLPRFALTTRQKARVGLMKRREEIRIGMPRVLNMYSQTPVFTAYFEALGVKPENLVYSDYTTEQLYKEGAKRGAIDPCFPSKVGHPARAQPALRAPQEEAARHHLLPDDRFADDGSGRRPGQSGLSDGDGHAGGGQGGLHQGRRPVRRVGSAIFCDRSST